MKPFLTLLLCTIVLLGCKQEIKESISPEVIAIDNALAKHKAYFDAPGIALGLIKNDTIIYADAQGVTRVDTKKPMTSSSVFHMASVSKPFVATAVVQLVEQGKIALDGKLTQYLPYFTMADQRYKDITIRQMLSHTSGIPNTDDYEWDNPQYDEGAAERYARSHKDLTLDFTPGEKYNYSNPAFDILCDVIAKASGMTFETYMMEHIFKPAGMKNSTFYKPDVPAALATSPHILGDSLQIEISEIYPYNRRHAGSSTLHSNVEDMLRWAQVYLNKGTIDGKQLFSEASYDLLTSINTPEGGRKVCLSWFTSKVHESPIYFHSGQDTGFNTFFGFVPEEKAAVVLMVNTDWFWTTRSAAGILKNSVFNDTIAPIGPIHFKLKDYILTEGIEKVRSVYAAEKAKTPQEYDLDPSYFDDLGYWLLDRNHPKEALEVFLLLVEEEPDYAGWVSSVGDAYTALDSIPQAIQWHSKALEMDPEYEYPKEEIERLLQLQSSK